MTTGVRRLWAGYCAVSVLLTVARVLAPEGSPASGLITFGYPVLTVPAIGLGIRFNRPARKLPWILLLVMSIAGGTGNVVISVYLFAGRVPFPSPADAFFLACYPLFLAGLMLLVDGLSWRRDRAGILDSLMVTVGLGLGVWLLFLRDLVGPAMALETRLVTMAYPLADLLLLAGVIRMFTSSARRGPAFWQLVASLAVQGLAHVGWVWQSSHGINQNELAPAFVFSALLLGGAALHPSMATVGGEGAPPSGVVTRRRVLLISSACLLCPVQLIANGVLTDGRVG